MKGTSFDKTACRKVSQKSFRRHGQGGQAAVEFALVLTVAMIVLFVAIQFALIGQAALALGQMNYQGARYAAVNTCAQASDVAAYMCSVGSPTITKNSGANLTVTFNGTSTAVKSCTATSSTNYQLDSNGNCSNSGSAPRSLGTSVTVQVSFNMAGAGGILFLQSPFLGVSFPTTLSSTETAMSE
jgi:Flp pilus assembly protein TadG